LVPRAIDGDEVDDENNDFVHDCLFQFLNDVAIGALFISGCVCVCTQQQQQQQYEHLTTTTTTSAKRLLTYFTFPLLPTTIKTHKMMNFIIDFDRFICGQ
jgi:hypothetical protein